MNATPDELTIQRHDGRGLRKQKDEFLAVYLDVYAERLRNPFFYPARFRERVQRRTARDGFWPATGRIKNKLVGFTLGSVLSANSSWWQSFKGDVDPDVLHETGRRTFAINELMVHPAWRRLGYATALSNALLEGLSAERATLLVRTENTMAYTAYSSWGFYVIDQMRPFDDSPLFEVMIANMRLMD